MVYYGNYLYHHGILGMHWGTRNGPPYPLGGNQMSSEQRKHNSVSPWARENISKNGIPSAKKKSSASNVTVLRKNQNGTKKEDSEKEDKHLTDKQKKIIKTAAIGAAVVAGSAALALGARQLNTAQKLGMLDRGEAYIVKKGTTFSRIAEDDFAGFTEGVYSAYRVSDRDLYTGVLGKTKLLRAYRDGKSHVTLNKVTSDAAKDLAFPTKRVRTKEFSKLVKERPDDVVNNINGQIKRRVDDQLKVGNIDKAKELEKTYVTRKDVLSKRMNKRLAVYNKWQDALSTINNNDVDTKAVKEYVKRLKDKGFDGILDENDNRIGGYKTKAPSIMFDTTESFTNTSTRALTPGEVLQANKRNAAKQVSRAAAMPSKNVGFEKVKTDSAKKVAKYNKQVVKDSKSLNANYTLDNLMNDYGRGISNRGVEKISKYMDNGLTYEEAASKVTPSYIDKIANKFHI